MPRIHKLRVVSNHATIRTVWTSLALAYSNHLQDTQGEYRTVSQATKNCFRILRTTPLQAQYGRCTCPRIQRLAYLVGVPYAYCTV